MMAKGIAGFGPLSLLWESFSNIWMAVKKNYQATDCTNAKEQIKVVFDEGRLIAYVRHGKYAAQVQLVEGNSEVRYAFNLAYMRQAVEHLWCIKAVMKQNRALIKAARLDRDDVYQDLSIRLIRAVGTYDADGVPRQ